MRAQGLVEIVGIVQEQHAERCRLFKQWQGFDWPIFVDSLNLYGLPVIPVAMAVDEHGILRNSNLKPGPTLDRFLAAQFQAPISLALPRDYRQLSTLRASAQKNRDASHYLALGAGEYLFGKKDGVSRSIEAFRAALKIDPRNSEAAFRLGVALRKRLDNGDQVPGDFQAASSAWSKALELNPGQYIWRRRIQQFGPRLEKPYNFYRWIARARSDLRKRGEKPAALSVPLTASEKMERGDDPAKTTNQNPDPEGKVAIDTKKLAIVSRAVVPSRVQAGKSTRLHLLLKPNRSLTAHWEEQAGPIQLWVNPDQLWQKPGVKMTSNDYLSPRGARSIELEINVPKNANKGLHRVTGFVLYPICEDLNGTCQFLRQDFEVEIDVVKK